MTLREALEAVRAGGACPGQIGILQEKALHATLKRWLDEDITHHEVLLPNGCVADIFDGERVIEIQTGNFSALRPKLIGLLEQYPVTVVCPLVHRKWLSWVDPHTGEASRLHRSPRVGSFADAGAQLVYLLPCLGHARLTVRLLLLDVEEHRLADGWSRDGKRGSHRLERYPLSLEGERLLTSPEDYAALIPQGLPSPFTAKEFGGAARLQGRKLNGTLKVLLHTGVLTREKQGAAYLYTITVPRLRAAFSSALPTK